MKPRENITRSQKTGYQWPHKRTYILQKHFKKCPEMAGGIVNISFRLTDSMAEFHVPFEFFNRKQSCRKVIFSQVCVIHSVHRGVCLFPACITGDMREVCFLPGTPPSPQASRNTLPQVRQTPTPTKAPSLPYGYYWIWSTSGQYASYWNAYLSQNVLTEFSEFSN